MEIKVFQVHKRASVKFSSIQDKVNFNLDTQTVAISDGTTQSIDSNLWAEILTAEFANNPIFNISFFISKLKNIAEEYNNRPISFNPSPAIASLEKNKYKAGSTATFLGIRFNDESSLLEYISCGDSMLFHCTNNGILSYPFKSLIELNNNNDFINSQSILNLDDELMKDKFEVGSLEIDKNDTIILATDALSRLFLNDLSMLSEFLKFEDFDSFLDFCLNSWDKHKLEEDDLTFVVLTLNKNGFRNHLPPVNFQFPEIEQIEFIPSEIIEPEISNIDFQTNIPNYNYHNEDKGLMNFSGKRIVVILVSIFLVSYIFGAFTGPPLIKSFNTLSQTIINILPFGVKPNLSNEKIYSTKKPSELYSKKSKEIRVLVNKRIDLMKKWNEENISNKLTLGDENNWDDVNNNAWLRAIELGIKAENNN